MSDNYAFLNSIKDPTIRQAIKVILDRLGNIEGLTANIGKVTQALPGSLDANQQLLANVKDPVNSQDAVNLQTLKRYVQAMLFHPPVGAGVSPPPPPGGTTPPPGLDTSFWVPPQVTFGTIQITGRTFKVGGTGAIWPWKGCTDFLLYKKYLDGGSADTDPIIADRLVAGANLVRVFGMCLNIAYFNPVDYPTYYSSLPLFADYLAAAGLQLKFDVFADAPLVMPGSSVQITHYENVVAALAGKANVFIDLGNELDDIGTNYVDPTLFGRPNGIVSSHGSNSGDQLPVLPPWDFCPFHPDRNSEWPRKAHSAMEVRDGYVGFPGVGRPVICDEPMGAAEVDVPGSRSNVPEDFYYFAATAMLLAGGATFHSTDGVVSDLFQPITLTCANNFFTAIGAIPVEAQLWTYTRGPFADCPIQHTDALALRTYARYAPNQAVCVVVRPDAAWTAIAQGGWTIASQTGPNGCVVFLTR